MAASLDIAFKAVAGAGATVFGAFVLLSGPRRRANQLLAAFLLLIASNHWVEAYRTLSPAATASAEWFRLATVFAILDPLVLYLFAAYFPTPNRLRTRLRIGLVATSAAALLLVASRVSGPTPTYDYHGFVAALDVYTLVVYTAVLIHVVRAFVPSRAQGFHVLFPAFAIAAIPVWTRTGEHIVNVFALTMGTRLSINVAIVAIWLPMLALASYLVLRAARHSRLDARAEAFVRGWTVIACVAAVLLRGRIFPDILVSAELLDRGNVIYAWLRALTSAGAAIRWLFFSCLVSVAVLRYGMLETPAALRRVGARVLVAVGFGCATLLALASVNDALQRPAYPISFAQVMIVVGALLFSQSFRRLVDFTAERVYGVPAEGNLAARLETYQAAVSEASASGRPIGTDAELARLRRDLGIDGQTASVVERLALSSGAEPLAPGLLVQGRYRIREFLGRGGAGRAFRAWDELLGRDVAIKEILTDDEESQERVLREARLAGGLAHPHIVAVHDVLLRAGAVLLVVEYVAGGSLAESVRARGRLPHAAGLRILDDVLSGLEAVHERGIVHGDVNPSNILLDAEGRAKLGDFGIARKRTGATAGFEEGAAVRGTPAFMAPEQRRGALATPQTDVYAVGLVAQRCVEQPLPRPLEGVLARALNRAPAKRWPDAGSMRRAMTNVRPLGRTRRETGAGNARPR